MGRKVAGGCDPLGGEAEFAYNTMWSGPRPTSVPSGILIHPTVWPQYTNVTDRQTNRRDNGPYHRTVLLTVPQKRAIPENKIYYIAVQ